MNIMSDSPKKYQAKRGRKRIFDTDADAILYHQEKRRYMRKLKRLFQLQEELSECPFDEIRDCVESPVCVLEGNV